MIEVTWKIWAVYDTTEPLYETTNEADAKREWLRLRNDGVPCELESPDGDTIS